MAGYRVSAQVPQGGKAVSQMDRVTQEAAGTTRESAVAARELST
jgi:hypothetical protein